LKIILSTKSFIYLTLYIAKIADKMII